jgi:DNA-binding HxlR family transcriptional regulator
VTPPTVLPVRLHAAALAVLEAARDQPRPSAALVAALTAYDRLAAPAPTRTRLGLPLALWHAMSCPERVLAAIRLSGRPLTAKEIHDFGPFSDFGNTRTALSVLSRQGAVVRLPGFRARYQITAEAATRTKRNNVRVDIVLALLERPVLSWRELSHATQYPNNLTARLRGLERRGLIRAVLDAEDGGKYWELVDLGEFADEGTDCSAMGDPDGQEGGVPGD